MAPNYFSLTNILLASSILFALTNSAPVTQTVDVEKDSTLIPRNSWSESIIMRPLDNLVHLRPLKNPIAPSRCKTKKSEIYVEASFNPRESINVMKRSTKSDLSLDGSKDRIERRFLRRRPWGRVSAMTMKRSTDNTNTILGHLRIGTTLVEGQRGRPVLPKEEQSFPPSERSEMGNEEILNKRSKLILRNIKTENSLIGPTEVYSGSLWKRDLKDDVLV